MDIYTRHQVATAAEAFAAGLFACSGYDVFVQYGANQPGFDLLVSREGKTLQISVKGSQNGGWILTSKRANNTYEQALDEWKMKNKSFVFCFVQFKDVEFNHMPRMYLVGGEELEMHLKTHAFGEICLSLVEKWSPQKGKHKGKEMNIKAEWKMTKERIEEVFQKHIHI